MYPEARRIEVWANDTSQTLRFDDTHQGGKTSVELSAGYPFQEGESRFRKNHAPQNLATLRHVALKLLKQGRAVKVGITAKRKMADWKKVISSRCFAPKEYAIALTYLRSAIPYL